MERARGRFSMIIVTAAMVAVMTGTTMPSPLFPIYQRELGISPAMTTVVFAAYAAGVIAALLTLGYLSDEIGRRRVLAPALLLSALSSVVFLFADSLAFLLVARVLSGISAGAAMGAVTAWLVDLGGKPKKEVSTLVAVAANVGGLALGPLLAGLLARFAPSPLRLPYAVDLAIVVPAALALAFTRETVQRKPVRLRIQHLSVPPEVRAIFPGALLAGVCGFAVSGVFGAVAPSYLGAELHVTNPAVSGLLLSMFFVLGAVGQAGVELAPKRVGFAVGCALLLIGTGLLAGALLARSVALLFASSAVAGLGQGLSVGCGLAQINAKLGDKRGETDSTYYVVLYVGVAAPAVGLGFLSLATGLVTAGLIFCAAVALCLVGALVMLIRQRESPPRREQRSRVAVRIP